MTQTILREGGREGGRDELRTESDMEEAHLSILGRFFTFLPLAISLSLGLWLGLRSSVSSLGTDPKTLHLLLDTLYWSAHVSWFYDVSKFPVVLPIILWRIRKYEGLTYNMGGGREEGGRGYYSPKWRMVVWENFLSAFSPPNMDTSTTSSERGKAVIT